MGRPRRTVGASVGHIIELMGLRQFSVLFLLCSCSSPRVHRFSLNHRCKMLRANCKYHLIQPSQPPLSLLFLPPSTFGPRRSRLVTCNKNTPLTLNRTLSLVNNNFRQFSVRTAQYKPRHALILDIAPTNSVLLAGTISVYKPALLPIEEGIVFDSKHVSHFPLRFLCDLLSLSRSSPCIRLPRLQPSRDSSFILMVMTPGPSQIA